ncbi:hypothetical protein [Eubacterium sp.]|uniref:hypothetical protein n=1 Tax=Eubacterium sp. TaxID=142586 RepID=UPI0026E05A8A|nr:hypothetical protein [Eubacterium sp.]MDO5432919.1 hypothetical protein [Eubacterium sp.]
MNRIEFDFSSIKDLKEWLERKNWNSESPEAFDNWLQNFFNNGYEISVNDKNYDYWDCWELV